MKTKKYDPNTRGGRLNEFRPIVLPMQIDRKTGKVEEMPNIDWANQIIPAEEKPNFQHTLGRMLDNIVDWKQSTLDLMTDWFVREYGENAAEECVRYWLRGGEKPNVLKELLKKKEGGMLQGKQGSQRSNSKKSQAKSPGERARVPRLQE